MMRNGEAEVLFKHILGQRIESYGVQHTDTLVSSNNLHVTYLTTGKIALAT